MRQVRGHIYVADFSFIGASRTIKTKPQSFSITIGNATPTLALAYTGVFSGDTITPSAAPTFKLTKSDGTEIAIADAVKTAGTYTITWSNMAGTNFDAATNYTVAKNRDWDADGQQPI
ncbi:MAG: hypothetical protein VB094_06525 [Oscillibacter sp.]|nr:hypothetical protein [Oscillibacter sp.]